MIIGSEMRTIKLYTIESLGKFINEKKRLEAIIDTTK